MDEWSGNQEDRNSELFLSQKAQLMLDTKQTMHFLHGVISFK